MERMSPITVVAIGVVGVAVLIAVTLIVLCGMLLYKLNKIWKVGKEVRVLAIREHYVPAERLDFKVAHVLTIRLPRFDIKKFRFRTQVNEWAIALNGTSTSYDPSNYIEDIDDFLASTDAILATTLVVSPMLERPAIKILSYQQQFEAVERNNSLNSYDVERTDKQPPPTRYSS